jgi:DNA-binding Xre family transcriptional regulator
LQVSYKKLWKLLIDKNMKKTDLQLAAGISAGTLAKLGRNETVSMDILMRICTALSCDIGDIIEFINDSHNKNI